MTNAEAWFSNSLRPRKPEGSLGRTAQDVHLDSHTGQWGGALRGISCEQKDAVQQLFESNRWPWNVEVTDVCETESTALPTSRDKPRPFVFKSSWLQSF